MLKLSSEIRTIDTRPIVDGTKIGGRAHQLKWMTSHLPSPSQSSIPASPIRVSPQLALGRITFALLFSASRTTGVYPIEIESPRISTLGSVESVATASFAFGLAAKADEQAIDNASRTTDGNRFMSMHSGISGKLVAYYRRGTSSNIASPMALPIRLNQIALPR